MKEPSEKIVSREALAKIIQDLKRRGSIIVTTNGSFDLLHIGHVTMLQEAKSLGDVLIVGMNSDASVRRYKGKYRPICSQNHRAEMLAALECTNYITIFDESTPIEFLKIVRPNIHVNSPEHGYECIEREIVEQHGGRIHLARLIEEMSTTQLIQRILDASSHEPCQAIFLNPADLVHENQEDMLNTLKQFQEMGFQLFLLEHPELSIVNCQLNPLLGGAGVGYPFTATYDAEDRMTSLEYTDSSSVVHRTEYRYSGDGFLAIIRKFENSSLVDEIRIVRDGFLAIQDRDENNAVVREYTWGLNLGGGIGGLLNLKQGGQDYSYLYDGKGNVAAVLDGSQAVVAAYRYAPFGKLLAKTGSLTQPFGFSTKRYDPQTGLLEYGLRRYAPVIGRWTTRDPLGEAGGMNLYAFVGNNPVNWVDPLGLKTIVIITTDYFLNLVPYGSHAAVYIDNNGNPIIYDPAGSYIPGETGQIITGAGVDLSSYVTYHLKTGSKVSRLYFDTTPDEESAILEKIYDAPLAAPGTCAMAVAGALNGIGPFKDLGMRLVPDTLYWALRRLQKQETRETSNTGK
jgi:rfaE bifunctional protein nucleotidyltransferase chain/domain